MKVLIAGWFSFPDGHATAGDLLARDLVVEWVRSAGMSYDVAFAPPFRGEVDWTAADPAHYSHVVFVCGPFARGDYEAEFLRRFANCILFGVDLTMNVPLREWNPFDWMIERDSSVAANPDITFLSRRPLVPVVGVCLVEPYDTAPVEDANAAIMRLVASREIAVVKIDTRLDSNETGLRTPSEIESLLARMDVVVTTRLHGMVLSLKNGIPVVAIDPERGGAKVCRQAERIGWPCAMPVDRATDSALATALDFCLTNEARNTARECAVRGSERVSEIRAEFLAALARPRPSDSERSRVRHDALFGTTINASNRESTARTENFPLLTRGKSLTKSLARAAIPAAAREWIKTRIGRPSTDESGVFGCPRRVDPVSREWGYDRGRPIDRYYVEAFLDRHANDIRGRVLEVGDDSYTRRFGGQRVTRADVLNPESGGATTVVGDLGREGQLPEGLFDCIILTQTLHLIYDTKAAIRNLHRALKPGGVLLATFPGLSPISLREWPGQWYWNFTSNSARRLFGEVFPEGSFDVQSVGNVLACTAFLYGLAEHELRPDELNHHDPAFELVLLTRAVRP